MKESMYMYITVGKKKNSWKSSPMLAFEVIELSCGHFAHVMIVTVSVRY